MLKSLSYASMLLLAACQSAPAPSSETPTNVQIEINDESGKVNVRDGQGNQVTVNANTKDGNTQVRTKTDEPASGVALPAGFTDWDQVLDRYEAYAQQWLKLRDAAMSGEINEAGGQVQKLTRKAEQLQESLDKARAGSTLSAAQERRYDKISARFMKEMAMPPIDLMGN